jgi:hypothetical protein
MLESRHNYYKVPEVELFMVNVLEKNDKIEPFFDLKLGYRYPNIEETIKMDSPKTINFLEKLFGLGILSREKYDMELRCPTCNSPNVSTNYICPHCTSSAIQRTILIEHKACGYLGTLKSLGQPLICPKCEKHLVEDDYRDAGSIYECSSCKKQIETPFISHWCRECNFKFSFENAVYQPSYSYVPAELTRKEMNAGILYPHLVVDLFNQFEFTRDMNTKVVGGSGVDQVFDLAFKGFGATFYVDILFSLEPLSEFDIIREYGKIHDANVNAYVIVLPGMTDQSIKFAKSYNMNIIEAAKPSEAISKLQTDLAPKIFALKANIASGTKVQEKIEEKNSKGGLFRKRE